MVFLFYVQEFFEFMVCVVVVCGKYMYRVVFIYKFIINDLKVFIFFEFKD